MVMGLQRAQNLKETDLTDCSIVPTTTIMGDPSARELVSDFAVSIHQAVTRLSLISQVFPNLKFPLNLPRCNDYTGLIKIERNAFDGGSQSDVYKGVLNGTWVRCSESQ